MVFVLCGIDKPRIFPWYCNKSTYKLRNLEQESGASVLMVIMD